jgi:hypothetical protein
MCGMFKAGMTHSKLTATRLRELVTKQTGMTYKRGHWAAMLVDLGAIIGMGSEPRGWVVEQRSGPKAAWRMLRFTKVYGSQEEAQAKLRSFDQDGLDDPTLRVSPWFG